MVETCRSVFSIFGYTLTGFLYRLFFIKSGFREELVGKAYQLLFQTNRQHIAMRNRKVLFFNLFQ